MWAGWSLRKTNGESDNLSSWYASSLRFFSFLRSVQTHKAQRETEAERPCRITGWGDRTSCRGHEQPDPAGDEGAWERRQSEANTGTDGGIPTRARV
jgi:hypothetical protein